ncbi:MAG: hypothetical protein ACI9OJ_003193, partial [Myxococcota bacterium]
MGQNQKRISKRKTSNRSVKNRPQATADPLRVRMRGALTAVPGSLVAATVLVMLFTGAFSGALGAIHVLLFLSVLAAGALRVAVPPKGKSTLSDLTRHTDMVLLPLAAIHIAAAALGVEQGLVFPLTLLVLVWAAAALNKQALIAAVGFAALCQIAS